MVSESYLSEDVQWETFIAVASEEMRLQEGFVPDLAWKFNNGAGSKTWVTLTDERSYKRMMESGAKRIRDRAKKEPDAKDVDLAYGWKIDLKVLNHVLRCPTEETYVSEVEAESSKKKKSKKSKKKSKGKSAGKRKHSEPKKVLLALNRINSHSLTIHFQPRKKAKHIQADRHPTPSPRSTDSDSESSSEHESSDTSDAMAIERIRKENHCARCNAPCMLLTNSTHHRYSIDELALWATLMVSSNCQLD